MTEPGPDMQVLRAARHRRMPWRNGGGETIEIAVDPPGAGLDGFRWRVSMASVAADGPFSLFEGIDRTIAILSGKGLELDLVGLGRHLLTGASPPFAFPGDVAANARLVEGGITDLNVMSRRGAVGHEVVRIDARAAGPPRRWTKPWSLLVAGGACRIRAERRQVDLEPGDALRAADGGGPFTAQAGADRASLFVVRFTGGG